ncbi:GvpL/GvpF family gas vesicle protein [Amycolatopsis jiangsuensis]|uniref:SRNA-binding protein n=1 Tax=Amycolatopsis jiangsuensis TaxID=1181879 RepID=A0A840IWZ4_9PSEU|nr:GvpL/GvpF family gas vesicle protein [Amycolatopsis jiangsuensis]MBB4686243.1 sRNA-binding protein [Amycolatopsis jiangsuensis]
MSWYCYAVTDLAPDGLLDGVTGLRGHPVGTLSGAGLTVVVSRVPDEDFSETTLQHKLENLAWLEEVARAHNDVVNEASRRASVLPLRLATIYHDEDRVRDMLDTHATQLSAALQRTRGSSEWGVKVFAPHPDSASEPPAEVPSDGRSYLRQRLRQRQARDTRTRDAADVAESVERELARIAVHLHRHRNQDAALSGRAGSNVLNLACLVPHEDRDRFLARARQLPDAPGFDVEVTGPWAPYSFAEVEVR